MSYPNDDLDELIHEIAAQQQAKLGVLPEGFYIKEHPHSRVGKYKAVHPGGWMKTNNLQEAEDWLWLCTVNHKVD